MDRKTWEQQVDAYLENKLTAEQKQAFEAYMAEQPECRRILKEEQELQQGLRQLKQEAPVDFLAGVRQKIDASTAPAGLRWLLSPAWKTGVGAVAACVIVVLAVTIMNKPSQVILPEATAPETRALKADEAVAEDEPELMADEVAPLEGMAVDYEEHDDMSYAAETAERSAAPAPLLRSTYKMKKAPEKAIVKQNAHDVKEGQRSEHAKGTAVQQQHELVLVSEAYEQDMAQIRQIAFSNSAQVTIEDTPTQQVNADSTQQMQTVQVRIDVPAQQYSTVIAELNQLKPARVLSHTSGAGVRSMADRMETEAMAEPKLQNRMEITVVVQE